jgi:hypothetical protein
MLYALRAHVLQLANQSRFAFGLAILEWGFSELAISEKIGKPAQFFLRLTTCWVMFHKNLLKISRLMRRIVFRIATIEVIQTFLGNHNEPHAPLASRFTGPDNTN